MIPPPRKKKWWQRLLHRPSDREVVYEVLKEPRIKEARRLLKRGDRLRAELEALEGKRQ